MKLIHIKSFIKNKGVYIDYTSKYKCCDKDLEFKDILGNTEFSETVEKECTICNKQFVEETFFGKQSAGYPIVKTFSKENN